MKAKTVIATALVWTALGVGPVRAQSRPPSAGSGGTALTLPPAPQPPTGPLYPATSLPPGAPTSGPNEPGAAPYGTYSLSSWIRGDKYGCCDHVGGDGPIQSELFFTIGPSIPVGHHGQVAEALQTGLDLGVGARAMFFNPCMDAAWDVEIGGTNIFNHAHASTPIAVQQNVPQNPNSPVTAPNANGSFPPVQVFFGHNGVPGVTLQDLNRTYFDIGGGKSWYVWGCANSCGPKARLGVDVGGRYGTESAEFHEIPHRNDVIAGMYAGVRADFECPLCGWAIFQAGIRVQYSYTWSDIMQIQNDSDIQDLNILFTIGIRF
jgi:hypothetical protein